MLRRKTKNKILKLVKKFNSGELKLTKANYEAETKKLNDLEKEDFWYQIVGQGKIAEVNRLTKQTRNLLTAIHNAGLIPYPDIMEEFISHYEEYPFADTGLYTFIVNSIYELLSECWIDYEAEEFYETFIKLSKNWMWDNVLYEALINFVLEKGLIHEVLQYI